MKNLNNKINNKNKKEYLLLLLKTFGETIKEEELEDLDFNDLDQLITQNMISLKKAIRAEI